MSVCSLRPQRFVVLNEFFSHMFQSLKLFIAYLQAIANLSVNSKVAKAVADEGGIRIIAHLARSLNKLVAEEAAGGLWNLSVGEEHKVWI